MTWSTRNGKLSKFFAFKDGETIEQFESRVKKLAADYNTELSFKKLGKKAVLVTTESDNMSDHTVSKAVENCYAGCWSAYRGTTKKAEQEKVAINIANALRSFNKVLGPASKIVTGPAKAVGKGVGWLAGKGVDAARGARNHPLAGGYGVYAGGRTKQLDEFLSPGLRPRSPLGEMTGGRAKDEIADYVSRTRTDLAANPKYQELVARANSGKIKDIFADDLVNPHLNALSAYSSATPLWKRVLSGSEIGLRGLTPLRHQAAMAAKAGDNALASALNRRISSINRNRLITGVGGAAGLGTIGAMTAPNTPVDNTPAWVKSLVGHGSDFVSRFSPTLANTMNQNPYATLGVGGAGLAALLYMLMSRNS